MEGISIALLSSMVGMCATLLTLHNNSKKEARRDTEHTTSVREEIKYISKGIEDIKFDTRSLTASLTNMNERLTRAEESIKTAHSRIDQINKSKGDVQ